jgi:hypothetical protein
MKCAVHTALKKTLNNKNNHGSQLHQDAETTM